MKKNFASFCLFKQQQQQQQSHSTTQLVKWNKIPLKNYHKHCNKLSLSGINKKLFSMEIPTTKLQQMKNISMRMFALFAIKNANDSVKIHVDIMFSTSEFWDILIAIWNWSLLALFNPFIVGGFYLVTFYVCINSFSVQLLPCHFTYEIKRVLLNVE